MNSTLSMIDTDFSLLVFKIINDRPFLVHYIPRSPDLVAFSEYKDSYNNTQSRPNPKELVTNNVYEAKSSHLVPKKSDEPNYGHRQDRTRLTSKLGMGGTTHPGDNNNHLI